MQINCQSNWCRAQLFSFGWTLLCAELLM